MISIKYELPEEAVIEQLDENFATAALLFNMILRRRRNIHSSLAASKADRME